MKAEDGTWRGISIDLWRRIASQTHLRYRFQETTLNGLTEGVAEGSLDAAVAALTVTCQRRRKTRPHAGARVGQFNAAFSDGRAGVSALARALPI
jgi:ABC-type amino acid transport substrate-binding protein